MNQRKISAFLIIALVLTNNSFATFAQYLNRINPFEKVSASEKNISTFQPHNERTDAVEIPMSMDITGDASDSWEGWYKNFIVDLNAVRFRFFDGNGVKVREEICLPSQFSGSSFSFENIYIRGEKDIILQDTVPYTISLVGFKFSDNIPCFRLLNVNNGVDDVLDSGDNAQNYSILKTDFTKISNPKLFNEWIDEENGINLDKLDKEVGFNLLDKEGKNISVSDWLKSGEDGKLNSITIEPIAFFPGSTEEIYESNKKCSEEYNMNFDNAFQRTLTNLKAAGEELELARINYKGSGNWFDNLVKGVTDAIDRAIETVESMGRWLDDNLLDGRINAMYTLATKRVAIHCGIVNINCSPTEYNYIYDIGEKIVEWGAGTAAHTAAMAALVGTGGLGAPIAGAIEIGVAKTIDKLDDLTPQAKANKEIRDSLDKDAGGGSYTKGFKLYRTQFIKSFVKLSYTDSTTYTVEWQKKKSITPLNYSTTLALPIPDLPDVAFIDFFQGLSFDNEELFERKLEEKESTYDMLSHDEYENYLSATGLTEWLQTNNVYNLDEEKRLYYEAVGFIDSKGNVREYDDYVEYYKNNGSGRKSKLKYIATNKFVPTKAFFENFASEIREDEYTDIYSYAEAKEVIKDDITNGTDIDSDISEELVIEKMTKRGYIWDEAKREFKKLKKKNTYTMEEAREYYIQSQPKPGSLPNQQQSYVEDYYNNIRENAKKDEVVCNFMEMKDFIWYDSEELFKYTIEGRGNCYVLTDYNAYTEIVVKSADAIINSQQEILAGTNALNQVSNEIYRYGCGLVIGEINKATESQILFKFHSNLDQIGGSGSIEEEYNLIGTIGSDLHIPKTYPDSIASSFTKEDGTNYTYKSYTTTQGLDGKAGSGKRFKVDSSKKLTQDLLDYAINKKEKENKKNLKERFEELGINTSNKLNEEEGFTEQISVNR